VAPVSSPPSATSTGSVRLRLNPTNAQAAVFVRAAGGRRGGHLRHPQDGPDPAVLVLRPGSTLGRGQACGRAVACRAVGLDVPVRHPCRTRGTLPFPEAPVLVSQVQGPPPGPAPVHDRRRSAPSAGSPAGRQVRVGRPRRAVPGAGPAPAAAGARPGPDTEHHRGQGRGRYLVRVGVLRTHHGHNTTDVQQAGGCRGRGGRRGQDRRGRGHRGRHAGGGPWKPPAPRGTP
jgi:hypothetical protein